MSSPVKSPLLRRSLVVLAFLGLVGLFFALNFFLYIPRQEQYYNNKIFRILSEISRDFGLRIEGVINKKLKTGNKENNNPAKIAVGVNADSDAALQQQLLRYFLDLKSTRDSSASYTIQYFLSKDTITANIQNRYTKQYKPHITLPIDSMLRPHYEELHQGLFKLLLLVKREVNSDSGRGTRRQAQDILLYHIGSLSTRFTFNGDSLFQDKSYGQFATVHDLAVQQQKFKAFCQPFRLPGSTDELLLIGLLPNKDYRAATAEYSFAAILFIIIMLVIVMLSLPVIKLAMCSRKEKVSINEVRLLMVVFLATPFLATLFAGTICIYQYADQLSTNTLVKLHQNIEEQLSTEVQTAYLQLDNYEARINNPYPANKDKAAPERSTATGFTDAVNKWLYPQHYKNLTDIFWVNKDGMQVGKWLFTRDSVAYLDLQKRTFFKETKKHVTHHGDSSFRYIEPTISWATGDFTVNMVKASNTVLAPPAIAASDSAPTYTAIMAGIAARLYSVCDPILPKGYQFAYIDPKGRILFHAQTMRALHENLLEEAANNRALLAAVGNGDSSLLRAVELYDHNNKMLISPSKVLPQAFLVTYCKERDQNLFVLHIMMFAFFCTCATLLVFLLFHLLKKAIIKTGQVPNIYRYPTTWMQPAASKTGFYKSLTATQLCLLAIQPPMALAFYDPSHWDELLLIQAILLPFDVALCYYLLRARYDDGSNKEGIYRNSHQHIRQLIRLYACFVLAITGIFFLKLEQQASIVWLIAPILLSAAMAPLLGLYMPLYTHQLTPSVTNKHSRKFEQHYLHTLLFSIVMIAILPTVVFLLYGFKQERQLKTESEQVAAAHALVERQYRIDSLLENGRLFKAETQDFEEYIGQRKWDTCFGIYLPTQVLSRLPNNQHLKPSPGERPSQSHIYRNITRFLFLPEDHADFFNNNNRLFWSNQQPHTLVYKSGSKQTHPSFQLQHQKRLGIEPLFSSVFGNMEFLFLCIALTLFFLILSQLIRGMVHRIFLLNLFPATTASLDASQKTEAGINRHAEQDAIYRHIRISETDRAAFSIPTGALTYAAVEKLEQEVSAGTRDYADILHLEYLLCPAYEQIWGSLKKMEQLVLYDFALDGITNYRNSDTIYKLYQTGLLVRKTDGHLELMSQSFRRYLIGKAGSAEVVLLEQQFKTDSSWKSLKNFSYMLFFAVMVFLFATQQDLSNKVIAIISGLATVIPLMIRLFDRNIPSAGEKG